MKMGFLESVRRGGSQIIICHVSGGKEIGPFSVLKGAQNPNHFPQAKNEMLNREPRVRGPFWVHKLALIPTHPIPPSRSVGQPLSTGPWSRRARTCVGGQVLPPPPPSPPPSHGAGSGSGGKSAEPRRRVWTSPRREPRNTCCRHEPARPLKTRQYKAPRHHTPQDTRADGIIATPTLCHPY